MRGASAPAGVVTLLLLGLYAGGVGAADEVVVRTSVTPEQAWVGQRVLLSVDVLGADGWAQIKEFGDISIPGTYVMRTESQGTRLNQTIGGTAYTGQRYRLSVYCQRPGQMDVPTMPVTVTVKQWGFNAGETLHEVTTPAASFTCNVPPGAEGLPSLISTTRLDAVQAWSAEPDTVAPGDAITRTVTLRAEDVSGMAFPPMQQPAIEGVGIYPGQPSVADATDRGSLRGERVERVTYVFEQPGEAVLPGIVMPWWDTDDGVLRRVELPGLKLEVLGELAPEPPAEAAVEPAASPRGRVRLAVVVVALIALALWLGRKLAGWYLDWLRARRESEAAGFRRVVAALAGRDPAAILSSVTSWLDRLDPGVRPARLDLFLDEHGDAQTRVAAAAVARCLATCEEFTDARALTRGLRRARTHLLRSRRAEQRAASVLPELNRATRAR